MRLHGYSTWNCYEGPNLAVEMSTVLTLFHVECGLFSPSFFFFFFLFFVSTPASFRLLYHLCRARPWRDSCPFAVMRVFLTSHSLRSEDRAWSSLSTGQLVTKLHYRRESWVEGDTSKTSLCFFYRWTCIKAIAVVSLSFSIHFSELFVVKIV